MFARLVVAAGLGAWLLLAPAAFAAPDESPRPAPSVDHPRDGGVIAGRISHVDYRRNRITVNRTLIDVMPSTQIQGSDQGFHVFTDLRRGMNVEVYTSFADGRYIAQIITLR